MSWSQKQHWGRLKGLMNWLYFNKPTLCEAPGAADVTADRGICTHRETQGQIGPSASRRKERRARGLFNHIRIDVSSAANTERSQTRTQHKSNDSSQQRRSNRKIRIKEFKMSGQTQSHPTCILTLTATISHCCN